MNYMKLLKLLYLSDREALLSWGRPITFDRFVSMKHGPVLSDIYDRISEGDPPEEDSAWHRHIRRVGPYNVETKHECPADRLSDAEEELLRAVHKEFGHLDKWKLVGLLHQMLPEWQDPGRSSSPIAYRDILLAGGKTDLEIAAIEEELEELAFSETDLV